MAIAKYLIPFYYTYAFNRKGLEGIAYFLEFTLLPFVILLMVQNTDASAWQVFVTLIVVTMMYEAGYIHNNVIAVRHESNPTIRHSADELETLYGAFSKIVLFRTLFSLLLLAVLATMNMVYALELLVLIVMMVGVFYLYNLHKSGWKNRVLYFLLRGIRYYAVLFFSGASAIPVSVMIAAVSFINHFAWYRERTGFGLVRFYGTKLFDALVYGVCFAILAMQHNKEGWASVFLYLSVVKIALFTVAVFQKWIWKKR